MSYSPPHPTARSNSIVSGRDVPKCHVITLTSIKKNRHIHTRYISIYIHIHITATWSLWANTCRRSWHTQTVLHAPQSFRCGMRQLRRRHAHVGHSQNGSVCMYVRLYIHITYVCMSACIVHVCTHVCMCICMLYAYMQLC